MSKKIISEFLVENTQELNEIYGIITVTNIKISQELSYMDIFVSALKNPETLTKDLAPFAHKLEHLIAKKIDFLKIPKIRFRYNSQWEKISHIHDILHKI